MYLINLLILTGNSGLPIKTSSFNVNVIEATILVNQKVLCLAG